jgi:hypothetical protein
MPELGGITSGMGNRVSSDPCRKQSDQAQRDLVKEASEDVAYFIDEVEIVSLVLSEISKGSKCALRI